MMRTGTSIGLAMMMVLVWSGSASAMTLASTDSGFYTSDGFHDASNLNYIAGFGGSEFRNFFVFDLSGISTQIASAELRLQTREYIGDASETYQLSAVTTSITDLTTGNMFDAAGVAIFGDLGSGTDYGSRVYTAGDENQIRSVSLNANAIAALNAALGGDFAVGGSVTTLTGVNPGVEVVFSQTQGSDTHQLVLTFVPEPSTGLLLAGGLGLMAAGRRARH